MVTGLRPPTGVELAACEMVARSFRCTPYDAQALRAGATIAVLGGFCAEEVRAMSATMQAQREARFGDVSDDDFLVSLGEALGEAHERIGWLEYRHDPSSRRDCEAAALFAAKAIAIVEAFLDGPQSAGYGGARGDEELAVASRDGEGYLDGARKRLAECLTRSAMLLVEGRRS